MSTTHGQDHGHKHHNPCPTHNNEQPTVDVAPPPVPNPPCAPNGPNCPAPTPPVPAPTPNPCDSPNNTCQPLTVVEAPTPPAEVVLVGLPTPTQGVSSAAVQTFGVKPAGMLPDTGSPTEGLVATSAWILLAGVVALAASKIRRPA